MSDTLDRKNRPFTNIVGLAVVFLLFPLGVVFLASWLIAALALHLALLLLWLPRGRRVLFVTSDSPHWKAYLDENIVARLPKNSVILNWSQRKSWSWLSLGVWLYWFWSGPQQYNPLAMIVRPLNVPRVFRFWSAFGELERGRPQPLKDVETAFLAAIGAR
jgi:hypothetical protein